MNKYVQNPTHFAAECSRRNGQCAIVRENILFLEECKEHTAITYLQKKCGNVVITPDTSNEGCALLYCTACERMADAEGMNEDDRRAFAVVQRARARSFLMFLRFCLMGTHVFVILCLDFTHFFIKFFYEFLRSV